MTGSTAKTVQLTARQLQVLEALRDGPQTTTDLSKKVKLTPGQIYNILLSWKERKLIKRTRVFTGRGVTGYRYLWTINDTALRFKHPSYDAIITITFPKRRKD